MCVATHVLARTMHVSLPQMGELGALNVFIYLTTHAPTPLNTKMNGEAGIWHNA